MLPVIDFNMVNTVQYEYLRNANFSTRGVEDTLAKMYGAEKVFLTNSGMEAICTLIDTLLPCGGKVVIDRDAYYETRQWLEMSRRFRVVEVDCGDLSAVEEALTGADLLFFDYPSHFARFYPVTALCHAAQDHGAVSVVDNTLLSLYYENPLLSGADYVVESYTKYVCGHGDCMAGGIVCPKKPDDEFSTYIGRRGRVVSPLTAYFVARGLETLDVRMQRHTENARFVSAALTEEGYEHWYAGKGSCIILPGKTKDFAELLKKFQLNMTFGTTYSTSSAVRSADLYNTVGNYVRLHCGLEDKRTLRDDVLAALRVWELKGERRSDRTANVATS